MAPSAYISRPVVLIGGSPNVGLALDLQTVLVEERTEGLYRCELCLNNYGPAGDRLGYRYLDRATLDFGAELAVEMGPPDLAATVFSGRISAIEAEYSPGGARMLVLAEDRLQDLRMTRRTRAFEDVSDEDVIRTIAGDHGLTPDLSLPGPTHKVLAQVNQSDLAFIRERARAAGAELWVDGTTLVVKRRPDRGGDPVLLDYGGNLISFSVRADLAHQCSEVAVSGWDVAGKAAISERAGESILGAELAGDTGGAAILAEALIERTEHVVHAVPLTAAEARAVAEARFRERARRFVTGSGVADGNPRIRVGVTLSIGRLGALFDGQYAVTRVRHRYDLAGGYRTEFEVERPGIAG